MADDYLSAREAAERLGVKLPTLYSYASRGLIQSIPGGGPRRRRYRRADLDRLRARSDARAGHGPVAASALQWGEPVLDTRITSISDPLGPHYRGRSAVELAEADVSFEGVAELLWSDESPPPNAELDREPPETWSYLSGVSLGFDPAALASLVPLEPGRLSPISMLALQIPLLAAGDEGRFGDEPELLQARARLLIKRMGCGLSPGLAADAVARALSAESVAATLAGALAPECGADGVRALNRALVLVADHELNASTFAARVAASTGADIYSCVQAAVATLSGPRHGGATDRVEALLAEVADRGSAERVVHERRRRGELVDGFGHPLYSAGDPRGRALMELAWDLASERPAVRRCFAVAQSIEPAPNLDFGLVTLSSALGLPRGASAGLFAVGRCAGWVAHVLEQYQAGYLVRPRARYTGWTDAGEQARR